jgi:hypothetical protein
LNQRGHRQQHTSPRHVLARTEEGRCVLQQAQASQKSIRTAITGIDIRAHRHG